MSALPESGYIRAMQNPVFSRSETFEKLTHLLREQRQSPALAGIGAGCVQTEVQCLTGLFSLWAKSRHPHR